MPAKKPPPAWEVILEGIFSQNRATIEAVQSTRDELKREIAERQEKTDAHLQTLTAAVRQNGTDIQVLQRDVRNLADKVEQNSADIRRNSADIQRLDKKVDNLSSIEARVSALERQRG